MFGPVVPLALADGRSVGLLDMSLASLLIAPDGKMFVSDGDAIGGPEYDPAGGDEHPVKGEEQPTIAIRTAATQSIEESSIVCPCYFQRVIPPSDSGIRLLRQRRQV